MNKIIIRTAKMKDIDSMIELLNQLFTIEKDFFPDYNKQEAGLKLLINKKSDVCVYVCEYKNKIIGMCTCQLLITTAMGGRAALIEDMIVDKEYRGIGIGKKLLNAVEKWAKNNNVKRFELLADKKNSGALDFYMKMNWKYTNLICLHKYS